MPPKNLNFKPIPEFITETFGLLTDLAKQDRLIIMGDGNIVPIIKVHLLYGDDPEKTKFILEADDQ